MLPFMTLQDDIRKTIRYARRNGVREAAHAAAERIRQKFSDRYRYEAPSKDVLLTQERDYVRLSAGEETQEVFRVDTRLSHAPKFSILVPACNPSEKHFRALVSSVLSQSYGGFELIVADAGTNGSVEKVLRETEDERIVYFRLPANGGISANTNAAARRATGDYVVFLDHDDMLTPDALYEMAFAAVRTGAEILYSDEDKCDSNGRIFYEPNRKPDFNTDYFFANNYICHLLVMKRELFGALLLRSRFDGAQDYDLLLRAPKSEICHVPKILYHWRVHTASTAGNPGSKDYAYEAGKAALEDYYESCGIRALVSHSKHRGFYRTQYLPDIFAARRDVGVVGGKLIDRKKRIVGGMMDEAGNVLFAGAHAADSGEMHRADTAQDAYAVDVRCMRIRAELRTLYREVFGVSYEEHIMPGTKKLTEQSIEFCRRAAQMGYLIVWDPEFIRTTNA